MNLVHLAGGDGTDPDSLTRFDDSVGIYPEFIGGDRIAHAATRNMACCAVAGQGAGIAAAPSIRQQCALDALDSGALQRELTRQGMRYR